MSGQVKGPIAAQTAGVLLERSTSFARVVQSVDAANNAKLCGRTRSLDIVEVIAAPSAELRFELDNVLDAKSKQSKTKQD